MPNPNIINLFREKKKNQKRISMVTCYDHSFAKIIAQTEIDCILVGDSLGMVFQGQSNTIPVTLEQMIYHTQAVKRGCPEKPVICDMPFLSYHVSIEKALEACGKVFKETGCEAIKIEGGSEYICQLIAELTDIGIPVMGHLGLTPQAFHVLGGHKLQARESKDVRKIQENSQSLELAGAFGIVLEMIPENVTETVVEALKIPTIGIGAGKYTDGQVLVLNDMLGMDPDFHPKFLKKYLNLHDLTLQALTEYHKEVQENTFPFDENIYL